MHQVRPAGEQPQHPCSIIGVTRLTQHFPVDTNDSIGPKYDLARNASCRARLRFGQAAHEILGRLVRIANFRDGSRSDNVVNSGCGEQFAPARGSRGENQHFL